MTALELQAKAAQAVRSRRRHVAAAVLAIIEASAHDDLLHLLLDQLSEAAREACVQELERQDQSLLDTLIREEGRQ